MLQYATHSHWCRASPQKTSWKGGTNKSEWCKRSWKVSNWAIWKQSAFILLHISEISKIIVIKGGEREVVGVFHVNDSQHAKQIRMFENRGCAPTCCKSFNDQGTNYTENKQNECKRSKWVFILWAENKKCNIFSFNQISRCNIWVFGKFHHLWFLWKNLNF